MDSRLTKQVIELGANDLSDQAMQARRRKILDYIDEVEAAGQTLPPQEFGELMSELFDLNIALGDAGFERDGDQ